MNLLPPHKPITCRLCYAEGLIQQDIGFWRMRNDPGAWGSRRPSILVLGFSKGAVQANLYETGEFDDVAFGGKSRLRLTQVLQAAQLLRPDETVDEKIRNREKEFAFGSLVRCSLARCDGKGYKTSTKLMPLAFKEVPEIIDTCTQAFLSTLPKRTRLVVMLGVDDRYIAGCRETVKNLYPKNFEEFSVVSYGTPDHVFVHVSHPSPGNGHHEAWLTKPRSDTSGWKREEAVATILRFGLQRAQPEEIA